jgi:hypothetical protein
MNPSIQQAMGLHHKSFGRGLGFCFGLLTLGAVILVVAVLPTAAASGGSSNGASQIVLSCTTPGPHSRDTNGCSSSELVTTPPIINGSTLYFVGGFWVWCQSPSAGTPYGPDCNGAMYIAEINVATGAGPYEATSIDGTSTAGPNGLQVTFTSSDGDMTCTLNVPSSSIHGGTLSGRCNGVPIVFSNAVINVT